MASMTNGGSRNFQMGGWGSERFGVWDLGAVLKSPPTRQWILAGLGGGGGGGQNLLKVMPPDKIRRILTYFYKWII